MRTYNGINETFDESPSFCFYTILDVKCKSFKILTKEQETSCWIAIEWKSFPDGRHFDNPKFGVIPENTVLTVNTRTGQIIEQWGNNTFYMPHGLAVDSEENLWLTDVGMHQVFKYSNGERVLTLGESFVPGNDESHFCKLTDVVVSNDGSKIYVADGYCNAHIVKFDSKGKFLKEYAMPEDEQPLLIPHSIVLIEALDLVCVADRGNGW
ncbi:unnamed protein product [Rotaria socialis]